MTSSLLNHHPDDILQASHPAHRSPFTGVTCIKAGFFRCASAALAVEHPLNRCEAVGGFAVEWRDRVLQLLTKHPSAPQALAKMGMSPTWITHPVWK
jgi:hypothetical protein